MTKAEDKAQAADEREEARHDEKFERAAEDRQQVKDDAAAAEATSTLPEPVEGIGSEILDDIASMTPPPPEDPPLAPPAPAEDPEPAKVWNERAQKFINPATGE